MDRLGARTRAKTVAVGHGFFRVRNVEWLDGGCVDSAEIDRDLSVPAWRRWSLLVLLLTIGGAYVATYALFIVRSENFITVARNQRAASFSGEHPLAVPAKLAFGAGQPDDARLGGGWHVPDDNGVWSALPDARIELVVKTEADFLLRFNAVAFVAQEHPQVEVALTINDAPMGRWIRTGANAAEPIEVRVPGTSVHGGPLAIQLHTDSVASPFRLRAGPDRRQLGILLSSIEVH
jgi:hypothetical protein